MARSRSKGPVSSRTSRLVSSRSNDRMGPLRSGWHRLQPALLRVFRHQQLAAVRGRPWRQSAGSGERLQHLRHRPGRCPRQFPQARQIRRRDRDRLARVGIPPLELRCGAPAFRQWRAGGRGRGIARLGGARQERSRQDRDRAHSARGDREVRLGVGDLHVLEIARLVVDADLGRRNPAGEFGRLELRLHQALDEILVRRRG